MATFRRMTCLGLVLLSLSCFTGCAHVRRGLGYALTDATDIVRADVSLSFGTDMGAHVMLTELVQLKSYSYEDLYRIGLGPRRLGIWEESREDSWVSGWHTRNMSVGLNSVAMLGFAMPVGGGLHNGFGWGAESVDEIGVGAHLFVAGFRVGIRPMEIADLFANFVGQDLCKDNAVPRVRFHHGWHKEEPPDAKPGDEPETSPAQSPAAGGPARDMREARERMEKHMEEMRDRMDDMRQGMESLNP